MQYIFYCKYFLLAQSTPLTFTAYVFQLSALYDIFKCKPFQIMPLNFITEMQVQFFKTSLINTGYFFFRQAYTANIIRTFFAYHITLNRQFHDRIILIQKIYNFRHGNDKFPAVALAFEKLYAKAVMRTQIKA